SDESHLFVVYCHHIVFDGYSADVLLGRIAEIYGADVGSDVDASATAVPFSAYIHATTSPAARESQARALEYWRGVYAKLPQPLDLPADHSRNDKGNHRGATLHRDLDAAIVGELKVAAKSLKS